MRLRLLRESREPGTECWGEMSTMLTSLTDGADLLLTGMSYEELAANVAEYRDIPLAAWVWFPVRVNGHVIPTLPAPLIRSAMTVYEWLVWRGVKKVDAAQRRELRLPKATSPAPRRIAQRGSLEIQAYDEVCFPGLTAEWAKWGGQRPFVGTLTVESPTDADEEVASWIAVGTPPIFFGFGSIPVELGRRHDRHAGRRGRRGRERSGRWCAPPRLISPKIPISSTSRWWVR